MLEEQKGDQDALRQHGGGLTKKHRLSLTRFRGFGNSLGNIDPERVKTHQTHSHSFRSVEGPQAGQSGSSLSISLAGPSPPEVLERFVMMVSARPLLSRTATTA